MNIMMHLGLSQVIRKAIEKELGIKLDRMGFMYGNIKPDLTPYLIYIPHFKRTAMGYVQAEIEKLTFQRCQNSIKLSRELSERLGMITHFLSDFFCYVHSDYAQVDMKTHFLYESRLLNYFQTHQKATKVYGLIDSTDILQSAEQIIGFIEETHASYLSKIGENRSSYQWDTANAVRVGVKVCISIVAICTERQAKTHCTGGYMYENSVFY